MPPPWLWLIWLNALEDLKGPKSVKQQFITTCNTNRNPWYCCCSGSGRSSDTTQCRPQLSQHHAQHLCSGRTVCRSRCFCPSCHRRSQTNNYHRADPRSLTLKRTEVLHLKKNIPSAGAAASTTQGLQEQPLVLRKSDRKQCKYCCFCASDMPLCVPRGAPHVTGPSHNTNLYCIPAVCGELWVPAACRWWWRRAVPIPHLLKQQRHKCCHKERCCVGSNRRDVIRS